MRALRIAELQTLEARILKAIASEDQVDPFALMLLLRGYRARERDDLRNALEPALSRALASYVGDETVSGRGAWLTLFVDAMALSDDERLRAAADRLIDELRQAWGEADSVEERAVAIDAALRVLGVGCWVPGAGAEGAAGAEGGAEGAEGGAEEGAQGAADAGASSLASDAVDALEGLVADAYVPGQGMMRGPRRGPRVRGAPGDQIRTASALLTAYEISGRLPYSMLAEELMQLTGQHSIGDDFVLNCEAARVLGRLAALHDAADYRAAAVVAEGADYRSDALRVLVAQAPEALARGAAGAIYALALVELEFPDWYVD